jgi:hypothetical protein
VRLKKDIGIFMARRGQKLKLKDLPGVLLLLGIIALFGKISEKGMLGDFVKSILVVIIVVIIALGGFYFIYIVCSLVFRSVAEKRAQLRQKRALETLLQKVKAVTVQNLGSLVTRRAQLVQKDAYGEPKLDKWIKEIDYFVSNRVQGLLADDERFVLAQNFGQVAYLVEQIVQSAALSHPPYQRFQEGMKPIEYEHYCAEELRRAGWEARVTMESRDQGVDVVAEKNHVRVVLQCKLYISPVGNKAVQEAAAGRAHERADYGVVVTSYTSCAEQLER